MLNLHWGLVLFWSNWVIATTTGQQEDLTGTRRKNWGSPRPDLFSGLKRNCFYRGIFSELEAYIYCRKRGISEHQGQIVRLDLLLN
jgi:hypothetical protein